MYVTPPNYTTSVCLALLACVLLGLARLVQARPSVAVRRKAD